jgi:hypothetical protein
MIKRQFASSNFYYESFMCRAKPSFGYLAYVIVLATLLHQIAWSQTPQRFIYPIGDYNVGKRLLFEGLTPAASHTFETTYNLSRAWNDQHGIDAVPSLCRNGQALYLAGDYQSALSIIDSGLALSYQCRYWTSYIDTMPVVLERIDAATGQITWFNDAREIQLATYPDAWPVAIGTQAALIETREANPQLALTYETVWIDAIELFYSQAMALRIRNDLLGELIPLYDSSQRTEQMFSQTPRNMPDLLKRCQNVCHAITLRGAGKFVQAKNVLLQNLTTDDGFDHPLTSIAFVELASIAAMEGNVKEAHTNAGLASLLAARLNQIDVLADAIPMVVRSAEQLNPGSGLSVAQGILKWGDTRFGLMYLNALSVACEAAAKNRDSNSFKEIERRLERSLRSNEIQLPHVSATYRGSKIKHDMTVGNSSTANAAYNHLVERAAGTETGMPLVPQLFQATAIQIALDQGSVPRKTLMEKLLRLSQRPAIPQWWTAPWQSFVWDNLPLNELYRTLSTSQVQIDAPKESIQFLSHWHDRQFRVANPLGSRKQAFQAALMQDANLLQGREKQDLINFQTRYLQIRQGIEKLRLQWTAFQTDVNAKGPDWNGDQHRSWQQLLGLSRNIEKEIEIESADSIFIPGEELLQFDFQAVQAELGADSAILGFFIDATMWGYCIDANECHLWQVPSPRRVIELQGQLLDDIFAYSEIAPILKSLEKPVDWSINARQMLQELLPPAAQQIIASKENLKIVPDRETWLMPFGLLLDVNAGVEDCWQAKHKLTYALSLSTAGTYSSTIDTTKPTTLLFRPNFYAAETDADKLLRSEIAANLGQVSSQVDVTAKSTAASFPFPMLNSSAVIAATELNIDFPVAVAGTREERLQLPNAGLLTIEPSIEVYLDITPQSSQQLRSDQSALFAWLNGNHHAPSKTILWRQWPVRGESTAIFTRGLLERSNTDLSAAVRSSILNLWEVDLDSTQEPRFSALGRRSESRTVSGSMPIFWANWKLTTSKPLPVLRGVQAAAPK